MLISILSCSYDGLVNSSCQSLLRALEDPVFSSKDLHSSLVEYEPFHILGVNYYQPPSSASRSLVESKQIQLQNIKLTICDDKELAFLLRMSDHFDLDQVQCLLILRECIEHVELTPVSLRAIVSEGKPKVESIPECNLYTKIRNICNECSISCTLMAIL